MFDSQFRFKFKKQMICFHFRINGQVNNLTSYDVPFYSKILANFARVACGDL